MATPDNTPDPQYRPKDSVLTVFEQYRSKLQRFLLDRSAKTHVAHDLTQEVYLRLLRFPPHELLRQPQAYLYRIASNVAHDFNLRTREECVTFNSDVVEELADSAANAWVDDPAEQLNAEQELEHLLAELPANHRAALVLAKRDGLSYETIAQRMGVSVHAVKKYVVRAMAHCRAAARSAESGTTE